jgi:hypothetical protein
LLALLATPAALALGCGEDVVNHYYTNNYYGEGGAEPEPSGGKAGKAGTAGTAGKAPVAHGGEGGAEQPETPAAGAGASPPTSEGGAGGGDGSDPRYPDAPLADTPVTEHELDIFGKWGNRYYFAVSDEQRTAMNNSNNGGCCQDGLYTPGGSGKANWVDHLFVTTAGKHPQTADYGKIQARVVGQYSRFPWDDHNIPNLNIDADQFIEDQRIAGYEHLRFNNGQRGSIFRDKMAYDLYRMLGYTAPLATYVWVSSNVWGPDVSIPYTLIERYKRAFCNRYADEYGGGCVNMWEFVGDFNYGNTGGGPKGGMGVGGGIVPDDPAQPSIFDVEDNCQIDKCDNTRVKQLEGKLRETPQGEGFAAALSEYIDWPAFQRFQCLSWVLSTTDDTLHAGNNVVLVERSDGLFQYLPYSVDISMGFGGWGAGVGLRGQNILAQGCQSDAACWAETLDVCEDVVSELTELDPKEYLKSLYDQLDAEGMLRPGDSANFQGVDNYFTQRLPTLTAELEQYRSGSYCEYPYVECGGQCVYYDQCYCTPPDKPIPLGAGGGPVVDPGPAGGAVGAGGAIAVGGGAIGGGAIGGGAGAPNECPKVVNYSLAR